MTNRPAGEITSTRDVIQVFRGSADYLSAISPVFANYEQPRNGHIAMSLYSLPLEDTSKSTTGSHSTAPSGLFEKLLWHSLARCKSAQRQLALLLGRNSASRQELGLRPLSIIQSIEQRYCNGLLGDFPRKLAGLTPIARIDEYGGALANNSQLDLFFQPIKSAGQLFALRIHSDTEAAGNALTVWLDKGSQRIANHVQCFVGGIDQGEYGVLAQLGFSPPTAPGPVPPALLYSPVTQCNLNCIHCISRESRAKVSHLSQSIKDQIRDWCQKGLVTAIQTDYSGDILWADARFGGELDFLISLNVPFHIDTNGVYLTREVSAKLMDSRVQWINISLDAASDQTYRRVRRGAPPLQEVLDNIHGLVAARAAAFAKQRVHLSMAFTLMQSNLDEWNDFLRLAAHAGVDQVCTRHVEAYTADMEQESLWLEQERFDKARSEALQLAAELGIDLATPSAFEGRPARRGHRQCQVPWTSLTMLGNGDVQVCCVPRTRIGNLHEQSMEEIWNGPAYQAFRTAVNSDRPPPMCESCPMFRKTNNPDSYLLHRVMHSWRTPYDTAKSAGMLSGAAAASLPPRTHSGELSIVE